MATVHNSRGVLVLAALCLLLPMNLVMAQPCGRQAGGAVCPGGFCCSQFGYCGKDDPYCGTGCQSQCEDGGGGSSGLASYFTAPYSPPPACYGFNQSHFPAGNIFAAGGDSSGHNIWNNGQGCGKVYSITCVGHGCRGVGPLQVEVVDHCICSGRAFDLSFEAFNTLADPSVGVINITYSLTQNLVEVAEE